MHAIVPARAVVERDGNDEGNADDACQQQIFQVAHDSLLRNRLAIKCSMRLAARQIPICRANVSADRSGDVFLQAKEPTRMAMAIPLMYVAVSLARSYG